MSVFLSFCQSICLSVSYLILQSLSPSPFLTGNWEIEISFGDYKANSDKDICGGQKRQKEEEQREEEETALDGSDSTQSCQ